MTKLRPHVWEIEQNEVNLGLNKNNYLPMEYENLFSL